MNRLIEAGVVTAYEDLFDEIVKIAQERSVQFGKLQVVDSVHVVLMPISARTGKDRRMASTFGTKIPTGELKEAG